MTNVEMDAAEKGRAQFLKDVFKMALESHGYAPETVRDMGVDIARLSGQSRYRLNLTWPGGCFDGSQGASLLLMLMQDYKNASGLNIGPPAVFEHDFEGDLFAKTVELGNALNRVTPFIIKNTPTDNKPAP